ncbi:MAG: dihydrolipoyl dehydrogenase [Parvularculales bacterium]
MTNNKTSYDVIIIGAGPGGYVAAIRAAQLGLQTAIIEREHLGGICLNWGCIPTKSLLHTAELYTSLNHLDDYGLSVDNPRYDLATVVKRSRDVSKRLSDGVAFLLKKNKIDVIMGKARFETPTRLVVEEKTDKRSLEASNIIIATGARARVLPELEPDGKMIWSYKEAMVPDILPNNLLVVGSGAIGIEFASFFLALSAQVTVAEVQERILPVEDEEISKLATRAFKKRGMTILTKTSVESVKQDKKQAHVTLRSADGKKTNTIIVDRIISAVGITGNTENLSLEAIGVKTDKGHIMVNERLETGVPHVYAIGDVAGPPWLAHKASHEGVLVAEQCAGQGGNLHPLDKNAIPGCTYCQPQIASIGLTEAQANEQGYDIHVGRFPFTGNGKAITLGETEGLVKTIFDKKTGELLGAHMIGAEVTELIQGYSIAKTLEATEQDLMRAVFPHPTLSEMMHESVLEAYSRALHI